MIANESEAGITVSQLAFGTSMMLDHDVHFYSYAMLLNELWLVTVLRD